MKFATALSTTFVILLAVAGCGGSSDNGGSGNVTPSTNSSLAGLWEAQTASIVGSTAPPSSVPSGDFYFNFTDVVPSSVNSTLYTRLGADNCLTVIGPDRLVVTGQNQYQDAVGDTAILVVSGNSLDATLSSGGDTVNIILTRTVGLSVSDLPTCRGTLSFASESDQKIIESILSYMQ